MELQPILDQIGEWVTNISAQGLNIFSEKIGIETTNLQSKLVAIFVLALIIFLATKITHKIAKIVLIIVGVLLIISIGASIV